MHILCLDIGSSSIKAGLWNTARRRALARARVPYPTNFNGPRAEILAPTLLDALLRAARLALRSHHADALSFCAFSSGIIIANHQGSPKTPIITHADRRSTATAQALVASRGKNWWLSRAANLPYPGGIGASTLAFLRQNHRSLFRGRYHAGQLSSFIAHFLTGQWTIDPSQAAFLGLWDFRKNRWHPELCHAVDIDIHSLPRIQWADQRIGGLTPAIARALSLPIGTPVVGGFVDTSAAVIQTPMANGQLTHNAGSTDVLAMCLDHPQPADGILSRPVGVGQHYPPKWLAVRTIASAGSAIQWLRTTLFPDQSDAAWQKSLTHALTDKTNPTLLPICTPTFAGDRAAIEQSPGAQFQNLHLSTTGNQLLTSLLKSLAQQSTQNFKTLAQLHKPQKQVFAMGGATTLAKAMHQAWPGKQKFTPLKNDSLPGLAALAQKTLNF